MEDGGWRIATVGITYVSFRSLGTLWTRSDWLVMESSVVAFLLIILPTGSLVLANGGLFSFVTGEVSVVGSR